MTGVQTCALPISVNLLCYRAWWACIAVVPVGIVCFHTYRKNRIQRRKEELYDSFRDLIAWMHTALRSGYSMENAVLEAAGQLEQSLGKENILVQELRRMRHKMMISVPVEQLFQDLAVRSRIDDIATFASVLVIEADRRKCLRDLSEYVGYFLYEN